MTAMSVTKREHVDDHDGPWTVEDVLALPEHPARARYELVDGVLMMSPAPGWAHQIVSLKLARRIDDAVASAGVPFLVAEAANVVGDSRLFIPDIVVVDRGAVGRDTVSVPLDAVLLTVEIVSPFNRAADRILKPALYAQAKVPAYWRVELEPEPAVLVHELSGDTYREAVVVTGKQGVPVAGEFTVDLDVPALLGDLGGA
ncbi:Uma2 family endonuclease [Streptomyces sp. SCUT-3]|uniref:Uma2 family endonuclease n=1 Tax=Streptomyces sp. SCUT-3 TaxID=2684469 RepID=UPI000CBC6879|nr:Uma2 family endonuclease [Streptomyces sp. SCUT-3]PLW63286.1 Uma2 family endonuclease [Streptomyces sp. DJ]QMV23154.1 Uma2 family endonuclease [Streptomyces sp. SCUT-3]